MEVFDLSASTDTCPPSDVLTEASKTAWSTKPAEPKALPTENCRPRWVGMAEISVHEQQRAWVASSYNDTTQPIFIGQLQHICKN